ncbi:hypothetical protein FIV42_26405 [Persicimonas caeni]|uniref:Uncharacterized protein n=1 Tax=Persicimonas caeni TaxID=2292766 RepID=A0A4Y6Q2C3_PERCE|nr:hypothetical protein [Persicimonas caeni]QDG54145.1 hypothetical protein FIV42_26405 [Persicimonas caeni]QED35366.1 hypothetical protein FRD00_26400 [Persicimonas caeni]
MNSRSRFTAMLAATTLVTTSLVGCGDDAGGGPEPQPVDHQTTRRAVENNTTSASLDLRASLGFMRQTSFLGDMVGELDGAGIDCGDGGIAEDGTASEPIDEYECEAPEPIEDELERGTAEVIDFLNTRVFVEANIEQQSDLEVTYLLDGQTMCQAEDFGEPAEHQDCIQEVDTLELRLVVTSFGPGDVDIEMLVGPDRHNPLDLEFHEDALAATTDLAELRRAMVFAASALGEELPELPTTMEGRIRAEFAHDGQAIATISVLQNVVISGPDYDIRVSKAQPATRLAVDTAAQTIHGSIDLNAIDVRAPVTETETTWDTTTGAETTTQTSYEVDVHLAGASLAATYAVGQERIDVQNAGLGDTTSTLDIDGKRVTTLDLNRDHGRHFDFSIVAGQNGTEFSVSPAFDLELMLKFAQVQDKLDGLDDWMLDELLRVTLDGAAAPAVRIGDSGVEVLDGYLTISSAAANLTHAVSAGQCLLPPQDDEPAPLTGTDSSDDGSTMPAESATHPLEDFAVGSCQ